MSVSTTPGQPVGGISRGQIAELGLRRPQRRHDLGFQRNHLDPEARIDSVELFAQQFGQIAGIAHRQRGGHRDLRHILVNPEKPRNEAPAAFVLFRQAHAQSFGKPGQGARQVLRCTDRFDESQALMPFDRRTRPIDGFVHRAKRLIQPQYGQGAEADGDLRTRNAQEVLHRAQAKATQSGHGAGVEPKAADRQIGQGRLLLSRWQNGPVFPRVCQCPGGPGGTGNRQAAGNGIPFQSGDEIPCQFSFGSENRGAAGDIQPQPIRRIRRGHRRIALAPDREPRQGGFIGCRIGLGGKQTGADGTRIGQRLAGTQPLGLPSHTHRDQMPDAADGFNRDERPIRRGGGAACQTRDRPVRQPHAEDASRHPRPP